MNIRTLRGILRRYIPHHHPTDGSKISREKHHNWKNGERKHGKYMLILRKHHPYGDRWDYVFRHRYRMELMLGRYLTEKEVVHHIDGNPKNDDESNLMFFASHSEHITFENTKDMTGRICRLCGTDKTYMYKNKNGKLRPQWRGNKIDGWLCKKCCWKIRHQNKK